MRSLALAVLLLFPFAAVLARSASPDPVSQVDPFIGTKKSSQGDNGNTLPGATRPFGMLYWSPDPVEGDCYR